MTPILDPRRAPELLADLYRRRAGYLPTFSPRPEGPGGAVLQIAADQLASLVERLDQGPDKRGLTMLDLVGVGLVPADPARAAVAFAPTPGVGNATAPAGSRLGARVLGRSDPLVFETESTIAVSDAGLVEIASVDPGRDRYRPLAADLGSGRDVPVFPATTPFAHELYLAHDTSFAFAGRVTVEIDIDVRVGASQPLLLMAAWWDGKSWLAFAEFHDPASDEDSHDGTDGLQHSGLVRLTTACANAKPTTVRGLTRYWIRLAARGSLSPGWPATLPLVERIDVRSVVEHRRVFLHVADDPSGTNVRVWTPLGVELAGETVTVRNRISGSTKAVTSAVGGASVQIAAGETVEFAVGATPTEDDYGAAVVMPQNAQGIDLALHAGLPLDKGICDGKTLDLTKSFQPLGPTPDVGAALYLACGDVFTKPGAEVTLLLDRPQTVQEEAAAQGHIYEIEINAARNLIVKIETRMTAIADALDTAKAALAAPLPDLVKPGDSTKAWYDALKLALKDTIAALTNTVVDDFAKLLGDLQSAINAVINQGAWVQAAKKALLGSLNMAIALRELGATTPGLDTAIHNAEIAGNDKQKIQDALLGLQVELKKIRTAGIGFLGSLPSFLATKPEDYVATVMNRIGAAVAAFVSASDEIRTLVLDLKKFDPAALVVAAGGVMPTLTLPMVTWEFWNGGRWLPVEILDGTNADAASFVKPGKVRFRVPVDWAECEVAGDTRRWLRARLASGRFARLRLVAWTDANSGVVNFLPVIEPHPPTLGGIEVFFRYASPTEPPQAALAFNDCAWQDLGASLHWPSVPFRPYVACADAAPTLYLGFDAPLPAERLGIFVQIAEQAEPEPIAFRCEAFDGDTFRPVMLDDGTRGMMMSGVLHLVWPGGDEGVTALVIHAIGDRLLLAETGGALRYPPGTTLWLADDRGGELVDVAANADRELTLARPVSRSYGGAMLRRAPPARFGQPRTWLRLVFAADAEPPAMTLRAVLPNAVMAANVTTVDREILGGSDGSPGQVLFLRRSPVLAGETVEVRELEGMRAPVDAPILRDELAAEGRLADYAPVLDPATGRVKEVWVRWKVRDTLAFSDAKARDCTVDRVQGRVQFGDGTFGRIPPGGRDNVRASYRAAGDGPDGNVPAGAIASILGGVLARGVTNPLPAQGGASGEGLDRLRRRGPTVLRHRHQALTAADYEALAYRASAAVARARALGATDPDGRTVAGRVRLVIVPDGGEPAPQPTAELRRQVSDLVASRMPLTVGRGLTVVGPRYAVVGVDGVVRPRRSEAAAALREAVRGAIAGFLHPVRGGPDGAGFAFGARIAASDLARHLAALQDLDALVELALVVDDVPAGEQLQLAPDRLPTAGPIRIAVTEVA